MSLETVDRKCWHAHMGAYLADPDALQRFISMLAANPQARFETEARARDDGFLFDSKSGVAVIDVVGPINKGESKYGGTNSIALRRQLRELRASDQVRAVVAYIDSPGGVVAGTAELVADMESLAAAKPVIVHAEDAIASKAMWLGSAATKINVSPMTSVGSIGVLAVVDDVSGMYEMRGIKVHVIKSGDRKGDFVQGQPVTTEALAKAQEMVDDIADKFIRAVAKGRKMSVKAVRELATGEVFTAEQAVSNGLADAIQTFDASMEQARKLAGSRARRAGARAEMAIANARLTAANGGT